MLCNQPKTNLTKKVASARAEFPRWVGLLSNSWNQPSKGFKFFYFLCNRMELAKKQNQVQLAFPHLSSHLCAWSELEPPAALAGKLLADPLSTSGGTPHLPSDSRGSKTWTAPSDKPIANWFGSCGCAAITSGWTLELLHRKWEFLGMINTQQKYETQRIIYTNTHSAGVPYTVGKISRRTYTTSHL